MGGSPARVAPRTVATQGRRSSIVGAVHHASVLIGASVSAATRRVRVNDVESCTDPAPTEGKPAAKAIAAMKPSSTSLIMNTTADAMSWVRNHVGPHAASSSKRSMLKVPIEKTSNPSNAVVTDMIQGVITVAGAAARGVRRLSIIGDRTAFKTQESSTSRDALPQQRIDVEQQQEQVAARAGRTAKNVLQAPRSREAPCKFTKRDILAFKQVFDSINKSGSGHITEEELNKSLQEDVQKSVFERVFISLKSGEDGFSFRQLLEVVYPTASEDDVLVMTKWAFPKGPPPSPPPERTWRELISPQNLDELRALFRQYNVKRDGKLSRKELSKALSSIINDKEIDELLDGLIHDTSDTIGFETFAELMCATGVFTDAATPLLRDQPSFGVSAPIRSNAAR